MSAQEPTAPIQTVRVIVELTLGDKSQRLEIETLPASMTMRDVVEAAPRLIDALNPRSNGASDVGRGPVEVVVEAKANDRRVRLSIPLDDTGPVEFIRLGAVLRLLDQPIYDRDTGESSRASVEERRRIGAYLADRMCPNGHGLMDLDGAGQHCSVCRFSTNALPEKEAAN